MTVVFRPVKVFVRKPYVDIDGQRTEYDDKEAAWAAYWKAKGDVEHNTVVGVFSGETTTAWAPE